jgi:hypothetical protein
MRERLAVIGFVLLCSLGALSAGWQVSQWGDSLSRVDPFSEANAIREARNFLEHGLRRTAGLGEVYYPGLYPDDGFAAEAPDLRFGVTPEGVYTHYPPGPEYLLYTAIVLLGPTPVWHLRLLPIAITGAASIWLGLSLRRRFGAAVGWIVMTACAALPMFSDAASFLHYDGYALALLLVEIAICLDQRARLAPFAALGFLQGWLSFDYVFLVALAPAAIELTLPRLEPGVPSRLGLATRRCVLAAAGFLLAHMLHFIEVWAFFGSFAAAFGDLAGAAGHRAGTVGETGVLPRMLAMATILKHYLVDAVPLRTFFWHPYSEDPDSWQAFRFLGLSLAGWWLVLLAALPFRAVWARRMQAPPDPALLDDWLRVSVIGLVPGVAWLLLMVNHAWIHHHFLFRHLFLTFFLWLLFVAVRVVRGLLPGADWYASLDPRVPARPDCI